MFDKCAWQKQDGAKYHWQGLQNTETLVLYDLRFDFYTKSETVISLVDNKYRQNRYTQPT